MAKLYDLAGMTVAAAPGTGPISLGVALPGLRSFAAAGVQDADVVSYALIDGPASEVGNGTYDALSQTLSRAVTGSTNGNAPIDASAGAQVIITPLAGNFTPAAGSITNAMRTPMPARSLKGNDLETPDAENDLSVTRVRDMIRGRVFEVTTPTYNVEPIDGELWVMVNPCTIIWPLAATMSDWEVLVKDGVGGAGSAPANNIHNVCTGVELIDGSADRKITTNRGFLKIKRNPAATGYAIVG
jgi:hypothetical protein